MHDEEYGHTCAVENLKIGSAAGCIGNDAPYEDAIECEEYENADKSPFFGEGGKDEVGLVFWQELQARLGAVAHPFSEKTSGADGDLRLIGVIAGTLHIGQWMYEIDNALLLIIPETEKP